jgi:transmembrane sensor
MFSMDHKTIADILAKSVTGERLTSEEETYLDSWLQSSEQNRKEYEFLTETKFEVKVSELRSNKSLIFSRIIQKKNSKKPTIRNIWIACAVAASIVIAFFIGGYALNSSLRNQKVNVAKVYNEIVVPKGAKSQLTLSDGTKVWLNGGSKLKYPAFFSSVTRDVFLEGEAYFDVSENKAKPFLVHTASIQIKVLGTAFNVKSYFEDKTIETTLVRGVIEIREVRNNKLTGALLIKPNQKAVLFKSKEEKKLHPDHSLQQLKEVQDELPAIEIDKVNVVPITAWKEKALVFANTTLEEMVTNLERWYGIKINVLNNSLKKYHYNGKFSHNETIYQVLEVIKATTPITYELKNYEINIDIQKDVTY